MTRPVPRLFLSSRTMLVALKAAHPEPLSMETLSPLLKPEDPERRSRN